MMEGMSSCRRIYTLLGGGRWTDIFDHFDRKVANYDALYRKSSRNSVLLR
jgi:hypothetical protein